MTHRKGIIFLVFIMLISTPALFLLWGRGGAFIAGPHARDITVLISKGTGLLKTAEQLEKEGVIKNRGGFLFSALITSRLFHLKSGEYLFPGGCRPIDALRIVASGRVVIHKVTIPEGLTVAQIVERLNALPHLAGDIIRLPKEGMLMPATYSYIHGDSRQGLLIQMQRKMRKLLSDLWKAREKVSPFRTPEEALILASIVEKETGYTTERARVAGVFINRLRKGMKLQADPTVIYAVTNGYGLLRRKLSKADLRSPLPHNTYHVTGLPPTPISCPGKKALEATLHPLKTQDLYFVANGEGGHHFANHYAAHQTNVQAWRRVEAR